MPLTSVSTYGSLQSLLQNINSAQNGLNTDQIAISSGQKSQTFDGLNGSVEQLTSLNAQIVRLTGYQQNNGIVTSQLQATNTALGQVQTIANSLVSLISTQTSGIVSTASFQQQVDQQLASLKAALNSTYNGHYLFSGTATTTAPVKDVLPTPAEIGVADTSYYQGSAQNSTLRVADDQVLTNSIRGDNPAFQQLFAGIAQALTNNPGTADLQNAEDLVQSGLQGVIGLQATVNANIVNLQQIDTQNQTLNTYFTGLSKNLTQSDVVALSTQVAQDQTVLEASFSTFARISSLSLANYLK